MVLSKTIAVEHQKQEIVPQGQLGKTKLPCREKQDLSKRQVTLPQALGNHSEWQPEEQRNHKSDSPEGMSDDKQQDLTETRVKDSQRIQRGQGVSRGRPMKGLTEIIIKATPLIIFIVGCMFTASEINPEQT